jgi:hypothetical protein
MSRHNMQPSRLTRRENKGKINVKNIRKNHCRIRNRIQIRNELKVGFGNQMKVGSRNQMKVGSENQLKVGSGSEKIIPDPFLLSPCLTLPFF